jgi:hypothetical protein
MQNKRDLTIQESYDLIYKYLNGENIFSVFSNHRKYNKLKNTFRFTANAISVKHLLEIYNDEQVINVYYNPAMPPPGSGLDGASLRFKVYIEYYQKEEE